MLSESPIRTATAHSATISETPLRLCRRRVFQPCRIRFMAAASLSLEFAYCRL